MRHMRKILSSPVLVGGGVLVIVSAVFVGMMLLHVRTDIYMYDDWQNTHVGMLVDWIHGDDFPMPPGFYFLVYALSGFSRDAGNLNAVAAVLLSLATYTKFTQTRGYLESQYGPGTKRNADIIPKVAALGLLLVATVPIIGEWRFHLGRISVNIWHNSTTILVIPLGIIIYRMSVKLFEGPPQGAPANMIALLLFVSIWIKPSFAIIYLPSMIAVCLYYGCSRNYGALFKIALSGVIGLVVLYLIIYHSNLSFGYSSESDGIRIAPFSAISMYSKNVLVDLALSIMFPLSVALLYSGRFFSGREASLVLGMFFAGLLVMILFQEVGARAVHGNFIWQAIIANYLLFMYAAKVSMQAFDIRKWSVRQIIVSGVFSLHVLSGVLYVGKILISGSYK